MSSRGIRLLRSLSRFELFAMAVGTIVCAIAAYFGREVLLFNPDAIIGPYMVSGKPVLNQMLFADWHTNLLKLPIFFIQSLFPYHVANFVVAVAAMLLITLFGWAILTAYAFGRRYFAPTVLLLSALFLGSYFLIAEIGFVATRNIEYPVSFLLAILFWKCVKKYNTVLLAVFITGGALLCASDPFFVYLLLAPLGLLIAAYYAKKIIDRRTTVISFLSLLMAALGSKAIIIILEKIGLFHYYGETFVPHIYAFSQLPQSFWQSCFDFLELYSANIFGEAVHGLTLYHGILFAIMLASAASLINHISKLGHYYKNNPVYATLLLAASTSFVSYVLAFGLDNDRRYLGIVVFVAMTSLVISAKYFVHDMPAATAKWSLVGWSLLFLALGFGCWQVYKGSYEMPYRTNKTNMATLAHLIYQNGANTVITAHTYASTVKFWSGGSLHIAPVLYCNQNLPFLTREQWYTPSGHTTNTAIVVGRRGRDADSWQCGQRSFDTYFGKPISEFQTGGIDGAILQVYIYPRDTLSKIHLIKVKGTPVPLIN